MNQICLANTNEFPQVHDFYWRLIDEMQSASYLPGWEKGVYPSDEFLKESLKAHELYVYIKEECIVSAMILNHACNDGYTGTEWNVEAKEEEVTVIHALGVLPGYQHTGIAMEMVKEAIQYARKNHQKAIRLDVLNGNVPALKLYESAGFVFLRRVKMFYEDTGWTDFLLYEFVV